MKNVTTTGLSINTSVLIWARKQALKLDISVSKFVSNVLKEKMNNEKK